ncbi:hypothetical protein [Paenibacillus sp. J2TS4]|uniref:hypothetical protein n=1 Tax=Paenibacillus sp. J2TS4 TaxID=2807194 RepID=UPI001B059A8B|nr:hypothetical protein [Paenibacillus sp. J2TS4]GIP34564.1 hypothetical protein J2TS4_37740 [Paenibacillus sp. J2TS4]
MKVLNNPVVLVSATAILYIFAGLMYMPWIPEAMTVSLGILGPEQGSEGQLVQMWGQWAVGIGTALLLMLIIYRMANESFHKWAIVIQLALIAFCMAAQLPPLLFWVLFALSDAQQAEWSILIPHLFLLMLAGWSLFRLLDELNGVKNS